MFFECQCEQKRIQPHPVWPGYHLSQSEDNNADVDFNFVLTKSGTLVELQGTSEKVPLSWEDFDQLKAIVLKGIRDLFNEIHQKPSSIVAKTPLFSLGGRLSSKKQKRS